MAVRWIRLYVRHNCAYKYLYWGGGEGDGIREAEFSGRNGNLARSVLALPRETKGAAKKKWKSLYLTSFLFYNYKFLPNQSYYGFSLFWGESLHPSR